MWYLCGMKRRYLWVFLALAAAAFLLWRFVRPMNIFVVEERFERPIPANVPAGLSSLSAEECGTCHAEIYGEWARSMHAMAWEDPYFQVDFAYDGSQQICLNCHTPLENQQENLVLGFRDREKFEPALRPNPQFDPALRSEGVTCAVCHVKDGVIVGPFETDRAPHPVEADPEMSGGMKPCERCHVVSGERWDAFYRIPPCGTVAEITEAGREPDCVGCHMPRITRPVARGMEAREGGRHLFLGGHSPRTVGRALTVEYAGKTAGNRAEYEFTLTNTGASHYLPTGTPDRHLTLEFRLYDKNSGIIKKETHTMKRHILWRPFIVELRDTRLPAGKPRAFAFSFERNAGYPPAFLEATVRYHLLDEKRRKEIGYENREPISYAIYRKRIALGGP